MSETALDPERHAAELESLLLDRPLATLYDISYFYGRLHATHLSHEFEEVPVDETYIRRRLTPETRPGYFDQEIGMVSVPIDISGGEPRIASANEVRAVESQKGPAGVDSDNPIVLEAVDREKLLRVGLSRQDSRASGHNMSMAHDVSGKDPSKCAGYVKNIFTRWLQTEIAAEVAKSHPDGWIIESLRELAADGETLGDLATDVEAALKELLDEFTGVISLRIRTDDDGPFHYPGELEVLNEVTQRRWVEKQMRGYSEAKDSAGEGTDFITGEQGEVFGLSDSPLRRYQGKMAESFPNLSPDASWQTRPLTSEAAFAVVTGSRILEEFVQLTRDNTQLYLVPYFSEPSVEEAVALYELARKAMNNDGQIASLLSDELTDPASPLFDSDLYIYYAMAYEPERKRKLLIEEPIVLAATIRDIAEAHTTILQSDLLEAAPDREPVFPEPPYGRLSTAAGSDEDDQQYRGSEYLMAAESDVVFAGLLHGGYFRSTFYDRREEAETDDYGATDPQVIAVRRCLGPNSRLNPQWLLQQYVPRLEERQRELFSDNSPAESQSANAALPESLLTRQYVQFQALAHAGTLGGTGSDNQGSALATPVDLSATINSTAEMEHDTHREIDDREERLQTFIESHPALDENLERRGAFLLGALVGRIAAYQKQDEISRTVIRQHPIDSLTLTRFSTTLNQVLNKNAVYSEQSEKAGLLMNNRYTSRLNDIVNTRPPSDWSLSTEDLRMHYGLGLSYGVNDWSRSSGDDDSSNE
jgi:hypothetical protein